MIKPEGWDSVEAVTNEFDRLPAGGYVCKIVQAQDTNSKSGKPMLVLLLDIAEGKYKDYFAKQFDLAKKYNPDSAKWRACSYHLYDKDNMGRLKGTLELIVRNNAGYVWNWDEKTLKNKKIGVIFREREYINNSGQTRTALEVYQLHNVEGVEDIPIPEKKTLEPPAYINDFGNVDPNEEVPF